MILMSLGLACGDAHTQAGGPPVTLVQASNIACKVGRANVKPREGVAWYGPCVDGLAQSAGYAQWSDTGKPTLRFDGTYARGLLP